MIYINTNQRSKMAEKHFEDVCVIKVWPSNMIRGYSIVAGFINDNRLVSRLTVYTIKVSISIKNWDTIYILIIL